MRSLWRVLVVIAVVLVSSAALIAYENRTPNDEAGKQLGPKATKARSATVQMRNDLRTIKRMSDREDWSNAHNKLQDTRRDWNTLVRDTYLTNENVVHGLDSLNWAIDHKEKGRVRSEVNRMDAIIKTLEEVIVNDRSGQ